MTKVIFLVGGDLVSQFRLRIKLKQSGHPFKVYCFDNADDALSVLRKNALHQKKLPDAVVLNVLSMGSEDWTFLQGLNDLNDFKQKPVKYIVAPFDNLIHNNEAKYRYGVRGFYTSPLTRSHVLEILQSITDGKTLSNHN